MHLITKLRKEDTMNNKNHLLMHRLIRPSDEEGRAKEYLGIGPSFKPET